MSSSLQLEVVTPDKQVVDTPVEYVSCPGVEGEFGVLKDHVSLLSALKVGALRYHVSDTNHYVFISGGFADVNNNKVTVLAESAELVSEIDESRAKAAKERAEQRLQAHADTLDQIRAEASLQRAMVRLQLTSLR